MAIHRNIAGLLAGAMTLLLGALASPAVAQIVACPPPGAVVPTSCTTSTTRQTILTTEQLADALVDVSIFNGAVGGGAVLSPGIVFAGGAAAVTTSGGPGIVIATPVVQSQSSVTGAPVLVRTRGPDIVTSVTQDISFGAATILVGEDQSVTFFVPAGTNNLNTNTFTGTFIHTVFQATTTRTSVYAIAGTVLPLGVIHTAVQSAGYDAGSGFLRRLIDALGLSEPPAGQAVLTALDPAPPGSGEANYWLEFYGSFGMTPAQNGLPGDSRTAGGLNAGASIELLPGLTLGLGIDHGVTRIAADAAGETGVVQLTQLGAVAAYETDGWIVRGALGAGAGQASVTTTLGAASTATYGLGIAGALLEVGHTFDAGAIAITPTLGADLTLVHTDAFTGSGAAGLMAAASNAIRLRAWLGLEATAAFALDDATLSLTGRGRLVGVLSGANRTLPVAFAGLPGTPLTLTGIPEAPLSVELGVEAKLDLGDVDLFAAYDARIQPSAIAHSLRIGLKGTF